MIYSFCEINSQIRNFPIRKNIKTLGQQSTGHPYLDELLEVKGAQRDERRLEGRQEVGLEAGPPGRPQGEGDDRLLLGGGHLVRLVDVPLAVVDGLLGVLPGQALEPRELRVK